MIRVPKFYQTVEDNIHMLYRNESTKRKNMFQGKKHFSGGGVGFFSNFRGKLTKKWKGGGDQHSFLGGIALCSREKFFQGGLRGVLPSMVTLPLFHLHFQNMSLTLCQTKFSKL